MPEIRSHLSSGTHEEEFGFERWTFVITFSAIQAALDRAARIGDPDYIKEIPRHYWLQRDRAPSRIEIADVKFGQPRSDGLIAVTVIIKRGHWVLASILRTHEEVVVNHHNGMVYADCQCCPGKEWKIPLSAFPEHRE